MTAKAPEVGKQSKFDTSTIVRAILGYEEYWRLMVILVLVGLLAGVGYFVYARATFQSESLIRLNSFMVSTEVAQGARADTSYRHLRALVDQLNSGYIILEAAKTIGIAGPSTTYNELRETALPVCRVSLLDQSHLQMVVLAFKPEVVKQMPQALVDTYEKLRQKIREEYREVAIKRYGEEIEEVRKRVASQLDSKLQFEEQSALASAQIEMERMSNVPVDIVRTKYRLKEHEEINRILADQHKQLDAIGKLSLVSGFNERDQDPLQAGRVVRKVDPTNSPFTFSSPTTDVTAAKVVVQPNMVEGLKPWQELEKNKREVEEKLRLVRQKFLDDHPEVIKLREELKQLESALDIELKVALSAFELEKARLTERLQELENKLPEYHKSIKNYDTKRQDYDLLEKSQLAWDKAYQKLSQRVEGLEFDGNKAAISLEFRGFTNLRAEMPVSPNKSKLLMIGCLLGIGLAGGVPFLLRRMDSSVVELTEFEGSLGINGIGLIPLSDPEILETLNRSPTVGSTVPNALLENFRLIRSSILLNKSPKGDGKVILITSARPSEGKTTNSSNVAWAFSSLGDKTLLIDCDLRRGRVHEVVDAPNSIGLTSLLMGQATLDQCIIKTQADNLWTITRGPVVPGTTELLNSGVFAAILEELKKKFDRIILDAPPVLGLSETVFLQHHADGVAIIVRCGKTMRKDVEAAVQSLQKLGAHFYGFILNGVDFSKKVNHYHYYYYSDSYYDINWEADGRRKKRPQQRE